MFITQTPIYFNKKKVGILTKIELDKEKNIGIGKIELKNFEVYSNMNFYNDEYVIGFPNISIEINREKPKALLDFRKDTIEIISRKMH